MDDLYYKSYTDYTNKYGSKTAILLQVGKFYEMYDSIQTETGKSKANVRELAEICGGAPEPKPTEDPAWSRIFWGFPEHSLPKYERILIQAGFTVVVISQDRTASGEIKGREVEYVSSPGTYMDPECSNISNGLDDRNIIGIYIDAFVGEHGKPQWSIATTAFDVSTGRCISTESVVAIVDGKPVMDSLQPFWAVYPPAEVVVWTTVSVPNVSESNILGWFTGFRGPIHMYAATKESESAAACRGRTEFLHRLYRPTTSLSTAEYLGLERHPEALQVLARLLSFVEDHNPSYLTGLRDHRLWAPEDELLLGNSALEQLAMLPLVKPNECLLYWLQKAYTAIGRRTLRQRCLKPITDVDELERRQSRIEELRSVYLKKEDGFERDLRGIHDLARIIRKLQLNKGSVLELRQLLTSYRRILSLIEFTKGTLSEIQNIEECTNHLSETLEKWSLDRILQCTTGHSLGIGPAHPWSNGIHTDMDAFEVEWSAIRKEVQDMQDEWERIITESGAIKVEWKEDVGFTMTSTKRRATCLETILKQRKKEAITIHAKASASIASIESPTLRTLNEKALRVWNEWSAAAQTHWNCEWSSWKACDEILDWVGQLDTEYAFARIAEEYGYVRPMYEARDETAGIVLQDVRHPILERVHTSTPYIAHSISLGCFAEEDDFEDDQKSKSLAATSKHGILLYGVNAAGKSSLSKAIGLSVLLAQCGIPVPASSMRIAPYNSLFTRILGNDNLWAGMSSFVVEMTEFRSILRSAGPKTLVLGDELCAGTETASAIAIVAAGIQTLVNKQTQFIFATHLHELMNMSEITELQTVKPYHLTVTSSPQNGGKLIYDRLLKPGSGSPMYGLEVCRGLDMDSDFLRLAIDLRKKLENPVEMSKASRYNAAVPVQVCNVCGSNKELETHHIVPQAKAGKRGFIDVGKHKNDIGNLVILCESCHLKHHSGKLLIKGWKQTSEGRCLEIVNS